MITMCGWIDDAIEETQMYKIIRETQHGRSEYKNGRWVDNNGHSYKTLKAAFKAHKRIIEQYPAYKDIVTISR